MIVIMADGLIPLSKSSKKSKRSNYERLSERDTEIIHNNDSNNTGRSSTTTSSSSSPSANVVIDVNTSNGSVHASEGNSVNGDVQADNINDNRDNDNETSNIAEADDTSDGNNDSNPSPVVIDDVWKACAYGDLEKLKEFTRMGEDVDLINKPDESG